jgi:epoxyqueuosine reductase
MISGNKKTLSQQIREKAHGLGFQLCGIAKARKLAEREPIITAWLEAGMNDKMEYLERNLGKRLDPEILFPGTRSLVVTGLSYFSENKQKFPDAPVLSRYTYGLDYHEAIIPKLEKLLHYIRGINPGIEGKAVSDSAPLLEKAWAVESGIGWQGRHSVVINREIGSFFFIGILILNIELDYDKPYTGERCGNCRICLDSCPTGAINDNGTIDTRRCIANITIENRGPIPEEFIPMLGRRVYGCDRCQEVCPWNKNAKPDLTPEFKINPEIATMTLEDWLSLSREQYGRLFKNSAVERVKYEDFVRNIHDVTQPNPLNH